MKKIFKYSFLLIVFLSISYFFFYKKDKIIVNNKDLGQLNHLDIIISKGQSIKSKLLNLFNLSESSNYTHVGLVCKSKGLIYILHATPDGTKENAIRYDDLQTFIDLSNVSQYQIVRLKKQKIDTIGINTIINEYKNHKYTFDYHFNNKTKNSLYCSEMIYDIFDKSNLISFEIDLEKPIYPKKFAELEILQSIVIRKASANIIK